MHMRLELPLLGGDAFIKISDIDALLNGKYILTVTECLPRGYL